VRLDFASWIARMRTPEIRAQAIRSLQAEMSSDVVTHFRNRGGRQFHA